jgi:glycosyltransferase involved in cell wall biosynthesis
MAQTEEVGSADRVPLISVIIPVYNGEKYLAECLNSIAAQNYPNMELVIIDDGSTDSSLDVVNAHPLAKTVVSLHTNEGVYKARNLALSLVKGDFICLFDCDDIMANGNLKRLISHLLAHPDVVIVKGLLHRFRTKDGVTEYNEKAGLEEFCLGASLIRKEAFEVVGLFADDMRWAADADWHLRSVESGVRIDVIDATAVYYRLHQHNMSNHLEQVKKSRLEVIRRRLLRAKNARS